MEEVHTIANLALTYHFLGKDYSIITPYDPQRAAIVAALKASDLPYDNVYNVDSFQGPSLLFFHRPLYSCAHLLAII